MSRRQMSERAVCPYYRGQAGSVIYCEGPLENSLVHLAFGSRRHMTAYMRVYCDDKYQRCMVAEGLERKYHRRFKGKRSL